VLNQAAKPVEELSRRSASSKHRIPRRRRLEGDLGLVAIVAALAAFGLALVAYLG
jgi:hypothetical protein